MSVVKKPDMGRTDTFFAGDGDDDDKLTLRD
jgi:hypothetical protein